MTTIAPGRRVTYWRAYQRRSGTVLSIDGDTAIVRPDHMPEGRHHISTRFECVQVEDIEG